MVKNHLRTLTAPVSWPIKRKNTKFVIRPNPGKEMELSMPLAIIFRDILKYCKTLKEVRAILRENEILVDGVRIKDPKYSVGLMDTISIDKSNEYYRVMITKTKKLFLLKITKEESMQKVSRIKNKTIIKGKLTQLNFYDGTNVLVKKDEYKVGDSLLLNLPDKKVKSMFKFEKGAYAFLIKGSHVGEHGTIESIDKKAIKIKTAKIVFEALKEAVFIVGKGKPEIKLD